MQFSTFVRIRPSEPEIRSNLIKIYENEIRLIKSQKDSQEKNRKQKFPFDKIFSEETKQEEIFEISSKPVIDEVIKGKNGALIVYGETGSGKTHTMLGSSKLKSKMAK